MVPGEPLADATAYLAKVGVELDAADALLGGAAGAVRRSGASGSRVLLVKGAPGPEDVAAGFALAGRDGDAARSALAALGIDATDALALCSRPTPGIDAAVRAQRLARYLAASDPEVVIALDTEAAEELSAAVGARLAFGKPVERHGRVLLAVDGLEASLDDPGRKKRVWAQFKGLKGGAGRRDEAPGTGGR
jgi:hypothetical protein